MHILLTNDDGINAIGIHTLAEELSQIGEVLITAPSAERSGASHAFTYRTPMRVKPVEKHGEFFGYAVDGMPVDCVKLGLHLATKKIDWVVSGMNAGANLGVDVFYSGTVQAAVEGTLNGYPSVAFSLADWEGTREDFHTAARLAKEIFVKLVDREIPSGLCINVNIPKLPRTQIRGIEVTQQAYHRYMDKYDLEHRHGGEKDYLLEFGDRVQFRKDGWILGDVPSRNGFRTDLEAIRDEKIAITPIRVDLTHTRALEEFSQWNLKL
ncbi:5'/3'-nucleotidase SurE [Candidatus Acetothermia bacterium]|nr:5'/3'-nucleotidase SurE [Candidatus Acetothermia bacterium]MBI3659221.1 5'/3'-nucleotidase SurE [Candidatus Acetothermia bacterium]